MKDEDVCLLVDNSNTRTKFALGSRTGIEGLRILPTQGLSVAAVQGVISTWKFNRVCICSVVPAAMMVLAEAFRAYPVLRVSEVQRTQVDFSTYPGISTLGEDRIANALAAVTLAALPVVAVDMGTATTFEVVVQRGACPSFAGGVIAPGYKSYAACLASNTAQLPEHEMVAGGPAIGRTTLEAMSAGVISGYAGMLDALLDGIERELGERVQVVLTGGDAAFFASMLRHSAMLVSDLTLRGLALAAGLS